MDYNLVWGIYWVFAWLFAVFIGLTSIEQRTLADLSFSMISGIITSGVVFGIGAGILHLFIG
jgi:hypothetical protein